MNCSRVIGARLFKGCSSPSDRRVMITSFTSLWVVSRPVLLQTLAHEPTSISISFYRIITVFAAFAVCPKRTLRLRVLLATSKGQTSANLNSTCHPRQVESTYSLASMNPLLCASSGLFAFCPTSYSAPRLFTRQSVRSRPSLCRNRQARHVAAQRTDLGRNGELADALDELFPHLAIGDQVGN